MSKKSLVINRIVSSFSKITWLFFIEVLKLQFYFDLGVITNPKNGEVKALSVRMP